VTCYRVVVASRKTEYEVCCYKNRDGELVQSETYEENILRSRSNYRDGRLHGDLIVYNHNGEVRQRYIYENGSLIEQFVDNDGVVYIDKALGITQLSKWKRVVRPGLNSIHKLVPGL